jgi:hypothetical protein
VVDHQAQLTDLVVLVARVQQGLYNYEDQMVKMGLLMSAVLVDLQFLEVMVLELHLLFKLIRLEVIMEAAVAVGLELQEHIHLLAEQVPQA